MHSSVAGIRTPRSAWICLLLCIFVTLPTAPVRAAPVKTVYYPAPESDADSRGEHEVRLLRLALEKAGGHYEVKRAPQRMQQGRQLYEVTRNQGRLDIIATMTSLDRERTMLPIRIPLDKGLMGWRLALVRNDQSNLLQNITNLAGLATLRGGQGRDWPDTDILRANGLTVEGVSTYGSLFSMLAAGRFDYLPRSIKEIWSELSAHPTLAVDPYLVIHYPAAEYFFVNRTNYALAEEIQKGLELCIADGSFDELFDEKFAEYIKLAKLGQRVVIELSNPLLSSATPLTRRNLWFRIEDLHRDATRMHGSKHP